MINYSVGDKVVCVDDKFHQGLLKFFLSLPVEGATYVVRDMQLGVAPDGKTGDVSVLLVGITNPRSEVSPFKERGFAERRFKPLSELTAIERKFKPDKVCEERPKPLTGRELVEA